MCSSPCPIGSLVKMDPLNTNHLPGNAARVGLDLPALSAFET